MKKKNMANNKHFLWPKHNKKYAKYITGIFINNLIVEKNIRIFP